MAVCAQAAALGSRRLYVGSTAGIAVGQTVRILQKDPGDGSLMLYLNGGKLPITPALKGWFQRVWYGPSRVRGVGRCEEWLPYVLLHVMLVMLG